MIEEMRNDRFALTEGQSFAAQPDQAAGGDEELHQLTCAARLHLNEFAAALADQFDDFSCEIARHIDREPFDGFVFHAVDLLADHLRFGDGEFIPFAAHGFDQHGQMEHSASGNLECFAVDIFNPQRNVAFDLLVEPFAQLAAADVFSLTPEERRIVDAEHH